MILDADNYDKKTACFLFIDWTESMYYVDTHFEVLPFTWRIWNLLNQQSFKDMVAQKPCQHSGQLVAYHANVGRFWSIQNQSLRVP
jgi:hypothetical protein